MEICLQCLRQSLPVWLFFNLQLSLIIDDIRKLKEIFGFIFRSCVSEINQKRSYEVILCIDCILLKLRVRTRIYFETTLST